MIFLSAKRSSQRGSLIAHPGRLHNKWGEQNQQSRAQIRPAEITVARLAFG
jgi:hypothetical protein